MQTLQQSYHNQNLKESKVIEITQLIQSKQQSTQVTPTSTLITSNETNPQNEFNITNLDKLPEKEKYSHAVNPLTTEDIPRVMHYFIDRTEPYKGLNMRDYMLFMIGINIWKRISDLRLLQVKDIIDQKGNIVESFVITEKKTKKKSLITINKATKSLLKKYLTQQKYDFKTKEYREWDIEDYLFYNYRTNEPISRKAAWEIFEKARIALNIDYKIGTHFLRKTGAKQALIQNAGNNEAFYKVMEQLGHSKPEYTALYVKLNEIETKEFMDSCSIYGVL